MVERGVGVGGGRGVVAVDSWEGGGGVYSLICGRPGDGRGGGRA